MFIARLSDSTPGKAMHKNSCFSSCSSGTEKNPIRPTKNALLKKNLKYDQEKRQLRSKAFKQHKAPDTIVLPSNCNSTGKNPDYCHSNAGDKIAFTQFCPTQSPGFTNKTGEYPSGTNSILDFYRWANDGLEERPTSCNRRKEEETSDLALKYSLGH